MIECKNLGYRSSDWTATFSFTADDGQWVGIAGPSGGGKSTLLNLLVGFLSPNAGSLTDDGTNLLPVPPHGRRMNYMFQQSSLLPHFSCLKNLNIALHDYPEKSQNKLHRIHAALEVACVSQSLLNRFPYELSGGELARMNLARTILRPCRWLLLDEPFAALDADLRLKILTNLGRWHREHKIGIFMVSHDPADAMLMADQLLFVDRGQVVAAGPPETLALTPSSSIMAKLLKTGSVFHYQDRTVFITPHHLFTSLEDLRRYDNGPRSNNTIGSLICANWRTVQLGAAQCILDLDKDQFWLLPLDRKFSGSFYFFEQSLHYLNS